MTYKWKNQEYKIEIHKKKTTKNLYIRVREDLTISITCHTGTSDSFLLETIKKNKTSIDKMLEKQAKRQADSENFYFLGKKYDLVYVNQSTIQFGEKKVFIPKDFPLDKWLKKQALSLFQKRLDFCYHHFTRTIPYPKLRIRKMKTRWGVCNTRDFIVTLNLELIYKDIKYLDYVIYHELSHLIYPNHSISFWKLVEENCTNCKQFRKELNQ